MKDRCMKADNQTNSRLGRKRYLRNWMRYGIGVRKVVSCVSPHSLSRIRRWYSAAMG